MRMVVVNFPAQPLNVDLYQIGEGIEILIPNVLRNIRAAHDLIGVLREVFKQGIFLGGQFNNAAAAFHAAGFLVDRQISNG